MLLLCCCCVVCCVCVCRCVCVCVSLCVVCVVCVVCCVRRALQLRNRRSFLNSEPGMSLHTTGMQQHCPSTNTTSCNCEITTVPSQTAPEELAGPVHRDVAHIVNELQLRNLHGQKDHGDQSLRHDKDGDDGLYVRTCTTAQQGTPATEPKNWGISTVF